MKLRIILSALLVMMITAGFNNKANANPWRYEHRGYCRPVERYCPPVRVYVPPVAVGYYGPAYGRPYHCAPRCYEAHREFRHGCYR